MKTRASIHRLGGLGKGHGTRGEGDYASGLYLGPARGPLGLAWASSPPGRVSGLPWVLGSSFDYQIFVRLQDMIVPPLGCVKGKSRIF